MYAFSAAQKQRALIWLCFWHTVVITSSNFLVQIPLQVGSLTTTWGAFTFPFIFLTTDLTVRIFGRHLARKIIFFVMFPALAISYAISVLFHDGRFAGISGLITLDWFVARIALASFIAYLIGQLLDISVFNLLRRNRRWWLAPLASTVFGNVLDTLVFFSVAFWRTSDVFMAAHWPGIAVLDYSWKILISIVLFLPAYGWILKQLTERLTRLEISEYEAALHEKTC